MIGHGPAWAYDEDGYCHVCGNGRWKPHHPDCGLADTLDLLQVAEAEMAALKARRCDGCSWWRAYEAEDEPWGECVGSLTAEEAAFDTDSIDTRSDHACNAWTAKEPT